MATQAVARLELSGLEKTAVLLLALGEECGAALLRKLPKEYVPKVVSAVTDLGTVRKEDAANVIKEALTMAREREGDLRTDTEYVRRVVESAFGENLESLMPSEVDPRPSSIVALDRADSKRLTRLLQNEHPQVIALLLANLKRPQAAELLGSFPAKLRVEVAVRMARIEQIPTQLVATVAGDFERRMGAPAEAAPERYRGTRAVADLINQMNPALSEEMLGGMGETDLPLANEVRDLLFVFEDLINLDSKAIREIVSRVDRRVLTVALKGTTDGLKDHILATMSQRGGAMLREDMEAMGPVKIKDVMAAQKDVLAVMRTLEAEGVVSTRGSGEQQYVD